MIISLYTQSNKTPTSEKKHIYIYICKYPRKKPNYLSQGKAETPCPFYLEGGLAEPVLLKHLPNNAQIVFSWCRDFLTLQATSQSFHIAECEATSYSEWKQLSLA